MNQREQGKSVWDENARIVWVTRDDNPERTILGVFRHKDGSLAQDQDGNPHFADDVPLFEDDDEVVAFMNRLS